MMTEINILDIRRLRQEAERDLDALLRVEAMLQRQRKGETPATAIEPDPSATDTKRATNGDSPNVGLKARVGEIVRDSGASGLRPRDVVDILEREFTFKDRASAAAAVSAALGRFLKKNQVEKVGGGRYRWPATDEE